MTEQEWEDWEEWLEMPHTQKLLKSFAARAEQFKDQWTEGLWSQPLPDALAENYPDLRARAQVYEELSKLSRDNLEELLRHEHDRN